MNRENKRMTIIGIIVLIFANSAAGGAEWCSSALADIANTFPDVPYWVITLVNNIPNFCAVVFTVVAGVLVNRKISLRNMILIGIGCHAVGGVLPALAGSSSMAMMFIGRFAFGVGYGLMQGIGVSMSFKLVENPKLRVHAMGWAVAAQYAMNMIAQVVVGKLVAIQWNYAFFIYMWSFIPFAVVFFLCPHFEVDVNDLSAVGGKGSSLGEKSVMRSVIALPSSVWIITVIVAVYMLCYYPMFLVIAPIIVGRGFGQAVDVGVAMIFYSVATIAGGIIFGIVEKVCKEKTICIFLVGVALSLVGLYLSHSYVEVCAWLTFSGITSTGIIPACINSFNKTVPESESFLATGIMESGVNIGAFLGTPFIAAVEAFNIDVATTLVISPVVLVLMGIATIRLFSKKRSV